MCYLIKLSVSLFLYNVYGNKFVLKIHTYQGLTNCAHGDERAPKEVFAWTTKLHARKSVKTTLSSTPM